MRVCVWKPAECRSPVVDRRRHRQSAGTSACEETDAPPRPPGCPSHHSCVAEEAIPRTSGAATAASSTAVMAVRDRCAGIVLANPVAAVVVTAARNKATTGSVQGRTRSRDEG